MQDLTIYSPPLVYLHALEKRPHIPQTFQFAKSLFSRGNYTIEEWKEIVHQLFMVMEKQDDVDAFLVFVKVCRFLTHKRWANQMGVLYHFGKGLFDMNHPHLNTYMFIMSNFAKING